MEVYCKGIARVRHSTTKEIYEIESEELDWDIVGSDERQMGPETQYQADVDHPLLGKLVWSLWEYPAGIENFRETNVGSHKLVEDFEYGLKHEEPEEWLDYSLSDNPFGIFMASYHHTGDLLADHGEDSGTHLINRMVFSQQVTALEAYLGDTLMKEVMSDDAAMKRLIDRDEDLAREKFTLAEIVDDPGLVERKVREHLRSVLYHNLAKVDVLYNIALGFHILPLATDKQKLFKSVILRHDCVHRNGFDKDGKELTVFTKPFVQETADLIKAFVQSIEGAVCGRATA